MVLHGLYGCLTLLLQVMLELDLFQQSKLNQPDETKSSSEYMGQKYPRRNWLE